MNLKFSVLDCQTKIQFSKFAMVTNKLIHDTKLFYIKIFLDKVKGLWVNWVNTTEKFTIPKGGEF